MAYFMSCLQGRYISFVLLHSRLMTVCRISLVGNELCNNGNIVIIHYPYNVILLVIYSKKSFMIDTYPMKRSTLKGDVQTCKFDIVFLTYN